MFFQKKINPIKILLQDKIFLLLDLSALSFHRYYQKFLIQVAFKYLLSLIILIEAKNVFGIN